MGSWIRQSFFWPLSLHLQHLKTLLGMCGRLFPQYIMSVELPDVLKKEEHHLYILLAIVLNLYNIVGGLFLCWMLFNHFVFNKDFFGQFQVEKDVEFKDEVLKWRSNLMTCLLMRRRNIIYWYILYRMGSFLRFF